jgi:hypothetical protein
MLSTGHVADTKYMIDLHVHILLSDGCVYFHSIQHTAAWVIILEALVGKPTSEILLLNKMLIACQHLSSDGLWYLYIICDRI